MLLTGSCQKNSKYSWYGPSTTKTYFETFLLNWNTLRALSVYTVFQALITNGKFIIQAKNEIQPNIQDKPSRYQFSISWNILLNDWNLKYLRKLRHYKMNKGI